MKKNLLFSMLVAIVFVFSSMSVARAEVTAEFFRNISYHPVKSRSSDKVESRSLCLKNGEYEHDGGFGHYEMLRLKTIALGDVDGNGKQDAVVILDHNTGGTQTIVQLALVRDVNGVPKHVASRNLGDRTEVNALKINANREIIVVVTSGGYSRGITKKVTYRVKGNRLVGETPFEL